MCHHALTSRSPCVRDGCFTEAFSYHWCRTTPRPVVGMTEWDVSMYQKAVWCDCLQCDGGSGGLFERETLYWITTVCSCVAYQYFSCMFQDLQLQLISVWKHCQSQINVLILRFINFLWHLFRNVCVWCSSSSFGKLNKALTQFPESLRGFLCFCFPDFLTSARTACHISCTLQRNRRWIPAEPRHKITNSLHKMKKQSLMSVFSVGLHHVERMKLNVCVRR